MPVCGNCGNAFSSRAEIDGRRVKLRHRKNCLDCVPFGSGVKVLKCTPDRVCVRCSNQYTYKRGTGSTLKYCASCMANKQRFRRKEICVAYKGGKCEVCEYSRCLQALTFHHLDPTAKKFEISGNHTRAWEIVKAELDKCVLLCHNCHAELHAGYIKLE